MKLNDLHAIVDSIQEISERTATHHVNIIQGLTGICWDEESADDLMLSMAGLPGPSDQQHKETSA